jgi:predicted ATPase/DNA-binding winged helix-turn-helix (wHTH) protein
MDPVALTFGPFELRPAERLLLEAGIPVPLGSRAMDVLIVLLEQAGQVVDKRELIARVWPSAVVEEATLRVHIAALRRCLHEQEPGPRYIVNVSGRGYAFVAPLGSPHSSPPAAPPAMPLAAPTGRLIGRDAAVASLVDKVRLRRFVTVVGPGGVGKTVVAQHAAARLSAPPDELVFVDLARLRQPGFVASAIASALGLPALHDDPTEELTAFLSERELLLLLDSCEHLVDEVARLTERLHAAAPRLRLLATSREPLRARGEWVTRLGPLDVPPPQQSGSAAVAVGWPAVQLFVDCAVASQDAFRLTDANAAQVSAICRRVDGMPLAIELVAARVDALGLRGLQAMLDDRLGLLRATGRRGAQERHRTLLATLDWSHGLLPEPERVLLRRLASFTGQFTLDAALAVAGPEPAEAADFNNLIANLGTKSLVVADHDGAQVRYRLLDTTRAYAREKLREAGEEPTMALRHASHCLELFRAAARETESRTPAEWLSRYAIFLDDVRAALDWAFASAGSERIGVELTLAAVPLWNRLLLVRECQANIERALATPAGARDSRLDMDLFTALGATMSNANLSSPQTSAAWARALELARRTGERSHQLQSLWGLWITELNKGRFRPALELARQFCSTAQGSDDPNDAFVGDRLLAYTLHFLGDQAAARHHITRMLAGYRPTERQSHAFRFQFDQLVIGRMTLAMILWLQGQPDDAMHCVEDNVRDGQSIGHPLSMCNALIKSALPVALLCGRLDAAQRYVDLLLEHTRPHSLFMWHPLGRCYEGLMQLARGELVAGRQSVRTSLDELPQARFAFPQTWVWSVLALADAQAGEVELAMSTIDRTIALAEQDDERWCFPELLRVRGEALLLSARPGSRDAARHEFERALAMARAQDVPGWARRAEWSLERLQGGSP